MRTSSRRHLVKLLVGLWLGLFGAGLQAEDISAAFEQANKLYEQGQFAQAAAAYEKLIQAGHIKTALYFNLGNAYYKTGHMGRAIVAYGQAQNLSPRDPGLRFNLQYLRKQVSGSDRVPGSAWERSLATLTLNEWTVLSVSAWWAWFLLLSLREYSAVLRKNLRGYTATAGLAAVLLGGCLVAAAYEKSSANAAVVVVPDAVVRYGPLEESKVYFQLRDGVEIEVLDQKEVTVQTQKQSWVQVRDPAQRVGWIKSDQVIRLTPAAPTMSGG